MPRPTPPQIIAPCYFGLSLESAWSRSLKTAGVFALVIGLWIVLTDVLVSSLRPPLGDHTSLDIYKGLLSVVICAGTLFGLFLRQFRREQMALQALRGNQAQLRRAESVAHVYSWTLDLASNRLAWSDELYRLLGLPRRCAALSQVSQSIVHARERQDLFRDICRSMTDFGGFRLVAIGEPDETRRQVRFVPREGEDPAYLDCLDLLGMQKCARLLGAEVRFVSRSEWGTAVLVRLSNTPPFTEDL